MSRIVLAPVLALLLSGCVAQAAYDVVTLPVTAYHGARTVVGVATAPVRIGGKMVDLATTSPSERDRKYLRRMRKDAERREKEERKAARHQQAAGE